MARATEAFDVVGVEPFSGVNPTNSPPGSHFMQVRGWTDPVEGVAVEFSEQRTGFTPGSFAKKLFD